MGSSSGQFDERRKRFVLSAEAPCGGRHPLPPSRPSTHGNWLNSIFLRLPQRGSEEALVRLVLSPRVHTVGTRKARLRATGHGSVLPQLRRTM